MMITMTIHGGRASTPSEMLPAQCPPRRFDSKPDEPPTGSSAGERPLDRPVPPPNSAAKRTGSRVRSWYASSIVPRDAPVHVQIVSWDVLTFNCYTKNLRGLLSAGRGTSSRRASEVVCKELKQHRAERLGLGADPDRAHDVFHAGHFHENVRLADGAHGLVEGPGM